MDRQTELLEKEDPRFYAIDKFNTGLVSIATEEKLDLQTVSFGLPSSPGLFLSLALNFKNQVDKINLETCFDKHPYPAGTWPENHKNLFDFFELMVGQIIFSYTALETFSNIRIPEEYKFQLSRIDPKSTKEYDKGQVERKMTLENKLDIILTEIENVDSPKKDKDLWDAFIKHKELRDRLIHLKSVDMTSSGLEDKTVWGDLLRNHKTDFVSNSQKLIGHFIGQKIGSRWFKKFPYRQK